MRSGSIVLVLLGFFCAEAHPNVLRSSSVTGATGASSRKDAARAWIQNWRARQTPQGKMKAWFRHTITGDPNKRVRDMLWEKLAGTTVSDGQQSITEARNGESKRAAQAWIAAYKKRDAQAWIANFKTQQAAELQAEAKRDAKAWIADYKKRDAQAWIANFKTQQAAAAPTSAAAPAATSFAVSSAEAAEAKRDAQAWIAAYKKRDAQAWIANFKTQQAAAAPSSAAAPTATSFAVSAAEAAEAKREVREWIAKFKAQQEKSREPAVPAHIRALRAFGFRA